MKALIGNSHPRNIFWDKLTKTDKVYRDNCGDWRVIGSNKYILWNTGEGFKTLEYLRGKTK